MGGVIAFMPAYSSPGGINSTGSRAIVPAFICPSDRGPNDAWRGQNNYAGNQGGWLCDRSDSLGAATDISPSETQTGIFYFLSHIRPADVTDGMSQTAFFSEKIRGQGSPEAKSDLFVIPAQTSLAGTFDACRSINPSTRACPMTALATSASSARARSRQSVNNASFRAIVTLQNLHCCQAERRECRAHTPTASMTRCRIARCASAAEVATPSFSLIRL